MVSSMSEGTTLSSSSSSTLGEYLSNLGLSQLRIAETEKYAHVTFFFNGGVEKQSEGEDRILVKSPKVATYDLKPEMSAYKVNEQLLNELGEGISKSAQILNTTEEENAAAGANLF